MQAFYSLSLFKRTLIGVIFSIIVAIIISTLLTVAFAFIENISLAEFSQKLQAVLTDKVDVSVLRFSLLIQSVSIFLAPAIVMLYALTPKPFSIIGTQTKIPYKFLMGLVISLILFIPGVNLISALNSTFVEMLVGKESEIVQMYLKNEAVLKQILKGDSFNDLLLHLFYMAIIPAVTEEFFFRGMLQSFALKITNQKHFSILLTAALFSLMHGDLLNFFPRMILGAVFGYAFMFTGTLWVPIIAHFVHNAIVVCLTYFINQGRLSENVGEVGDLNNIVTLGILSIAIFSFIVVKTFKKYIT